MKLFLVQHGDALAKEVDPDRPLSEKGRQDINHMASFLKSSQVQIYKVLHSGKTRAAQTAEILSSALVSGASTDNIAGINPNDSVSAFAQQLGNFAPNTMLVGHLPFMGKLVAYLLSKDENRPIVAYQPGSVVCLERVDKDVWTLVWMVRPELFIVTK